MSANALATPVDLKKLAEKLAAQRNEKKTVISLCAGTGCTACGCEAVAKAFKEALKTAGKEKDVELRFTGCLGFCERGPIVVLQPNGTFYQGVQATDAKRIVEQTIVGGKLVNDLLYIDPLTGKEVAKQSDIPFFKKQTRLVFEKNGQLDPTSINDYIALGGYSAMAKALSAMNPETVIETVIKSGLKGRGGGGFATGEKWADCRKAKSEPKYTVCNADEGDPGAFMDRVLLEGNPHSIIEGMIIGAYAVGSHEGFIYVRNEYTLAIKNLMTAIAAARELGMLGDNILGSGFSFNLELSRGGGAFVCGESTAMFASLEGKTGEPRAKYVHTVETGLWDKPTNLNKVETWANIPRIIDLGAEKFAAVGTNISKGTKVFALTGNINNSGLAEAPMGTTLREILFDIGEGVPRNKKFKALMTGGLAGGTLVVDEKDPRFKDALAGQNKNGQSVNLLDLPVNYDSSQKAGAKSGWGGMIVMDEDTCMVDIAKYFVSFLLDESCGKCLPCREGLRTMLGILSRITDGKGEMKDLDTLEELSQVMMDTSLCMLGGSAPNPVLSTMKYFRDEYIAHIRDHVCAAGVCKELVSHAIDESCIGCQECAKPCPTKAITGKPNGLHIIDQGVCIQCGACHQICSYNSVRRVKRGEGKSVQTKAKEKWQPPVKKSATVAA